MGKIAATFLGVTYKTSKHGYKWKKPQGKNSHIHKPEKENLEIFTSHLFSS